MGKGTSQEDATLLDVLIDAFEKNEIFGGYHWRELPVPDTDSAVRFWTILEAGIRAALKLATSREQRRAHGWAAPSMHMESSASSSA
jgi:hypothetical protein